MNYKGIQKIHFVGIKGVGMAPLAIIAKEAGFKVSGSDVMEDFVTEEPLRKAGIRDISSFSAKNVEDADLVICTAAHGGFDNVEVTSAKEKNIPILTQGEAVGVFQEGKIFDKNFEGIAVAGSHGKTTTTAMIATVLSQAGLDPSYSIGTGEIPSLPSPGHFGKGKFFVCEADEYISYNTPKFLFLNPKIIVITNIDFDHPDVYQNINQIEDAFLSFVNKLPEDGILIACGDGSDNSNFLNKYLGRKITYGFSPKNDYSIDKIGFRDGKTYFWVKYNGSYLGEFAVSVFGEQNALDALGAIIAGMETGLSLDKIKDGIAKFKGSKRRSEYIGTTKYGADIYDDYAHHPAEINNTLAAFKKTFPDRKIIAIFQPHMYSRTKQFFNDFVSSLEMADEVILTEIFPSFREEKDENFSARSIADAINLRSKNKSIFLPEASDVVKYVNEKKASSKYVFITMGAGDIYRIHSEII